MIRIKVKTPSTPNLYGVRKMVNLQIQLAFWIESIYLI